MGNLFGKTSTSSDPFSANFPLKFSSTKFIKDSYSTFEELQNALRRAGLESCQLIIGVDFTKSNEWQGGTENGITYSSNQNLHYIHPHLASFCGKLPELNPYQQVLSIMCEALKPFDSDGKIDAYGYGDIDTQGRAVFPFNYGDQPCNQLEGVLSRYNELAVGLMGRMSGPTSFVPIINKAIDIVTNKKEYHILIIIADGMVDDEEQSKKAIIRASKFPLSIICIGVGRGPWKLMEKFDDNISGRDFDNFQFVNFHKIMHMCENIPSEFAKHALMEIPEQLSYIKSHGLLNKYY